MDAAARVIKAIKEGTRVSGRLVSQIPAPEVDEWLKKHSSTSVIAALYCEALGISAPVCAVCGAQPTRFLSTQEGFSPYCGKACARVALGAKNRANNAERNRERGRVLRAQMGPDLTRAVALYTDPSNAMTIQEVAQLCDVSNGALRTRLAEMGTSRTDIKTRRARASFAAEFPQLSDPTFFKEVQGLGQTSAMVAETVGVHPNTICVYARQHGLPFPKNEVKAEHDIATLLSSHVSCERRNRSAIAPKEIDVYVPSKALGIEHNGCFWHSEAQGRDRTYHLSKQMAAEASNVRLIQLWDYEWTERQSQAAGFLLAAVGVFEETIPGRKTRAETITKSQARDFLDANHLHGYSASRECIGLFHGSRLVAVATFGRPRFSRAHDVELVRFATLLNTRIVGGLSKLVGYYKETHGFTSLVSYAHRRLFTGRGYTSCGFKLVGTTPPGYFWINIKTGERKSRYQTQKHKLNTDMTEVAYMQSQGYTRVWDCGQLVFEQRPN